MFAAWRDKDSGFAKRSHSHDAVNRPRFDVPSGVWLFNKQRELDDKYGEKVKEMARNFGRR